MSRMTVRDSNLPKVRLSCPTRFKNGNQMFTLSHNPPSKYLVRSVTAIATPRSDHLWNPGIKAQFKSDSKHATNYNKRTQRIHESITRSERRKEGYDDLRHFGPPAASTPGVVLGEGAARRRGDLHVRLQYGKVDQSIWPSIHASDVEKNTYVALPSDLTVVDADVLVLDRCRRGEVDSDYVTRNW